MADAGIAPAPKRVSVTKAALLEELMRAKRDDAVLLGACRTRDLKDATGWSMVVVRRVLEELGAQGVTECVWLRIRTLSGRKQKLPHYRIVDGISAEEMVKAMIGARDGKDVKQE